MRKTILLGIMLTVFLILIIPSVNAIEFYQFNKTQESILSTRLSFLDNWLETYDSIFSKNVVGMVFIILSLGFLVIVDFLSVLGWMLLGAWDSSVGLGIAVIISSGVGAVISLIFLLLGCISNPEFIGLLIPVIIALSPVYLPVLIWSLS